jgi:hypothetical protein
MPKYILSTILLVLLCTLCSATPRFNVDVNEVPFSFESGLVIVEAKIKGDVPVQVVISTGAERSIIDPRLLEKYKLPAYYAADGPVTGSNDSTYSFTKVSSVSVPGGKSKDVDMRFGPIAQVSQAVGREIFAALGADYFEGQIVQFDFKKRVIRFLDKSPADTLKDKIASSGAVLRMAEKASNPFQRTFMIPIVSEVTINGQKSKLLLDTGRAASLAFSSSAAKKAGLSAPADNSAPREDKLKSLRLGEYEMADVPAMLYAKGTSAELSLSKYGVVAGTAFLQNFLATFDFRGKYVVLERA